MERKYTPELIRALEENEVFVFGSNLAGMHGGGAARAAMQHFGAIWGQGVGLQGQSYAIPTMQGGVDTIKPYTDDFTAFAREHNELFFWVTRIGCGIAGFTDEEIAPLFDDAYDLENVALPESFCKIIEEERSREAVSRWTNLNLVQMNRMLRGEDPNPPKKEKTTADSWKRLPMPPEHVVIPVGLKVDAGDWETIEMGHFPEEMEDHWFMYCDEKVCRWYRSWTGLCIYEAEYRKEGEQIVIGNLTVNRNPQEYGQTDDEADRFLFLALMAQEMGYNPEAYWKDFYNRTKSK